MYTFMHVLIMNIVKYWFGTSQHPYIYAGYMVNT